jgi:hypothetical protein
VAETLDKAAGPERHRGDATNAEKKRNVQWMTIEIKGLEDEPQKGAKGARTVKPNREGKIGYMNLITRFTCIT